MSFTLRTVFSFGTSHAGLADLRAQPYTAAGVTNGAAISAGFTEVGRGMYRFSGTVTDNTAFVDAYSLADAANIKDSQPVPLLGNQQAFNNTGQTDLVPTDVQTVLGVVVNPADLGSDGRILVSIDQLTRDFFVSTGNSDGTFDGSNLTMIGDAVWLWQTAPHDPAEPGSIYSLMLDAVGSGVIEQDIDLIESDVSIG